MLKIDNHKVLGTRGILIKLEEYPEDIQTNEAGIYTPMYENFETDGGKPDVRINLEKYSTLGVVLQISEKAQELLNEEKMDIKIGDKVAIYNNQKNAMNQFFADRTKSVIYPSDFEGYLTVVPSAIQSKIIK